jgi:hypothetical protein
VTIDIPSDDIPAAIEAIQARIRLAEDALRQRLAQAGDGTDYDNGSQP